MTRATVSRVLDITALKVELKAGTHQAEQTAPGIVAFDPLFTAKSAPASTELPADTFSTRPQRWTSRASSNVAHERRPSSDAAAAPVTRTVDDSLSRRAFVDHRFSQAIVSLNPLVLPSALLRLLCVQGESRALRIPRVHHPVAAGNLDRSVED